MSNMDYWFQRQQGFSLIELTIVIVVIGVLVAVAMQSMTALVEDSRQVKTEREMEMLANAIVGNPSAVSGGTRCDFGYVGDVGAFPPSLQALYQNPGGYATWDGPYIAPGFTQDSTGFKTDEWGALYGYSGGIILISTGSGSAISKKIADAVSDYLFNRLNGTIRDASDSLPGSLYCDSVDIKVTIPDGCGGSVTRTYHPDSTGAFTLDSLPVGRHELRIIYTPAVDTLFRYATILPRHKGGQEYRFAASHFSPGGGSGCTGSGADTLCPVSFGTVTELNTSGCTSNWECVGELTADNDITYVESSGTSYCSDTYLAADPADTSCTVVSVTACVRARRFVKDAYAKVLLRTHGMQYEGAEETLTDSFTDYCMQWTTNPNTGAAWTWSEASLMEIGISLRSTKATHAARCTQVWVVVQYSN